MAIDAYLKIDDAKISQKIVVESFSFGVSVAETTGGSGRPTGKPTFSDLTITKFLDKSSPVLYEAAATGLTLKTVELVLLPAVQKGDAAVQEATFTLSEVQVTSVQEVGNSHGGVLADEQVRFDWLKIEITVDNNRFEFSKNSGKI